MAVVDAVAFQEIDAVPDQEDLPGDTPDVKRAKEATRGINAIPLPRGSHPFGIAMNATSTRAYVSDEQCGKIYVLDTSPYSATYNTLLGTIDVGTARLGLRGLDLSANGYYLYVAAPGQLLMGEGSGQGRILVVELPTWYGEDVDAPLGRLAYTIGGLGEPYGVTATTDPDVVAFADRSADRAGVGLITMKHPAKLTKPPTFSVQCADLTELGRQSDTKTFAVANAEAVAVTADLKYAFVTGFNKFVPRIPWHDPYVDPTEPCGGNVGIIRLNRDSKGVFHPELVAATRPIPVSFPDNLVLSPDGKYLYAAYRGQVDAVFVFDVPRMIQVAGDDVLASQCCVGWHWLLASQCCVGWHCWLVQQCSGVWPDGRSPFRMAIFPLPTG